MYVRLVCNLQTYVMLKEERSNCGSSRLMQFNFIMGDIMKKQHLLGMVCGGLQWLMTRKTRIRPGQQLGGYVYWPVVR